jgi:uncharacterized membrane protein YphA (DoxX/SURF4 family)
MADEGSKVDAGASPSWGLVLIRIVVGGILLNAGWMKITGGVSDELVLSTKLAFEQAPDFVRSWGEDVVLPHPTIFSHLIAFGEFFGGLALFLGALTRPAGLAVAFMFANFYFAGPEQMKYFVLLLSVCGLGCALSRAGSRCGADVFLDQKLPRWMTWR